MSFLKVFGQVVSQVAKIVTGLGPLLPSGGSVQDKVIDTIEQIASAVLTTEALAATLGIAGPDKLKAVTPLVAQLLLQSDMLYGKKIKDPVLFKLGAEAIADGMAKVLNSIEGKEVDTRDI